MNATDLITLLREQVANIENLDASRIDQITLSDLMKAYSQFSANVERAFRDADRRFENGQMFF